MSIDTAPNKPEPDGSGQLSKPDVVRTPIKRGLQRVILAGLLGASMLTTLAPQSSVSAQDKSPFKPDTIATSAQPTFLEASALPPIAGLRLPIADSVAGVSQGPRSVDPNTGEACSYEPNTHTEAWGNAESIDLSVRGGTPIVSMAEGTVVYAGWSSQAGAEAFLQEKISNQYGIIVMVEHVGLDGESYQSLYGHLSETNVQPGDIVRAGQLIGKSGKSSTKHYHLHVDVRKVNQEGLVVTVPIRALIPWMSKNVLATCINGQRYDALVIGNEYWNRLQNGLNKLAVTIQSGLLGSIQSLDKHVHLNRGAVWDNTPHAFGNSQSSSITDSSLRSAQSAHRVQAR